MPIDFDAGIEQASTLFHGYAIQSLGWLESCAARSSDASDSKAPCYGRLKTAAPTDTGVNIDEEMAILIDLEQAYQASARIVKAVDQMLQTLMDAVN